MTGIIDAETVEGTAQGGQVAEGKPTVFEAVLEVMREVRAVGKDGQHVQNGKKMYNFRGIDGVMNAVGPAFRTHGVMAVPMVEDMQRGSVQTRNATMTTVQVKMRVRWYGPAGDYFDSITWGEAFDSGDKATAKAHSVAFRTAILETLCLPTQEPDPDEFGYERATPEDLRRQQEEEQRRFIAQQSQHILDAEKAGNVDGLRHALANYRQQGHMKLVQITAETIDRLERNAATGPTPEAAQQAVQEQLGAQPATQ